MKRTQHIVLSLTFLLCSVGFNSNAQIATTTLDTTHYLIGDWIPLTLEVTAPIDANVIWPVIDVNIGDIEVLDRTEVDSTSENNFKTLMQELTLTVFDTGYYPIPAFHFIADEDTLSTLAKLVIIQGVEIDSLNAPVKDIKTVLGARVKFKEILPYLLIGLGVLLLVSILLYFLLRKKPEPIIEEEIITIPPHEWAYEALQKLEIEDLWQQGYVKEYYIRLTDILRQYIELRYKQPALESTTDEIMDRLRLVNSDRSLLEQVRSTLVLSDFVKFAKAKPLVHEHESSFEVVKNFVDVTKIEEIVEEKEDEQ